jgi:hypothetical protein
LAIEVLFNCGDTNINSNLHHASPFCTVRNTVEFN